MCTYQSICYWVRVNEDGSQKKFKNLRFELKKKEDSIFWNEEVEMFKTLTNHINKCKHSLCKV